MEGVRRDSSHWVLGSPSFFFSVSGIILRFIYIIFFRL